MIRCGAVLILVMSFSNGLVFGQGPQRGTIKQVDMSRRVVTITVEGKDLILAVTERTVLRGVAGDNLTERLKALTAGTAVQFMATSRGAQQVLVLLATVRGTGRPSKRVMPDISQLKPLSQMGKEKYFGFQGGLYPDGSNVRPKEHEAMGVRLAQQTKPLDASGKPDAAGKIVLLSIGMSNASQSSQGFQRWLAKEATINPQFVFVNGAQGGMTAEIIQNAHDGGRGTAYWDTVDQRLKQAGVTREQVQAVWIKEADAGPVGGFPGYARKLQSELSHIVQLLPTRYPNCAFAYLSSRTYGGYAKTPLNPEPFAYESGFAVKWLIEQQIGGEPKLNCDPHKGLILAPWLSWGPYLWANGTTPRADGLRYEKADFRGDGTHLAPSGQEKVGKLLLEFFKNDSTTRRWFLKSE